MGDTSGSTSSKFLRSVDLLSQAQASDPSVSERTLEFWRHQGLLPHPQRLGQAGKKPVWGYPPEAAGQLAALLLLRAQTKDLDVLRGGLWYDGYPIETSRARAAIASYLRKLLEAVGRELTKQGAEADRPDARWQAIQKVARRLAAKRGKGFPRLSRQNLDERAQGMALGLGLLLNDDSAMARVEADGTLLERLMGVDRARRFRPQGVQPWLDGPPEEGLLTFARTGGLERLITVVESASDAQLEVSRELARTLLDGVVAFSRIADAIAGRDNSSGMHAIRLISGEPTTPMFIVPVVLSILSSSELAGNLEQVLMALRANVLPVDQQAKELASLPEKERLQRLELLSTRPFIEQVQVKRLLAEYECDVNSIS